MTKKGAISLLSGGLDSAVATHMAAREFRMALALTFDYGQRAAEREVAAARALCEGMGIEHRVIGLPWLADITATALVDRRKELPEVSPEALDRDAEKRAAAVWVPNRNGVFIAIAAAFAESIGAGAIVAGFNAEEAATFPDNSAAFVEAANAALGFSTSDGVRVMSPVLSMAKSEIAAQFVKCKLASGSFWCCYDGGEKLCGRCESCARTIRAFKGIGAWEAIRERFA